MKKLLFLLLLLLGGTPIPAQTLLSLDSALARALSSHPLIELSGQEIRHQRALQKGSFSLPNTEFILSGPAADRLVGGVLQSFDSPFLSIQQAKVARQNVQVAQSSEQVNRATLTRDVRVAYLALQFAQGNVAQLAYQDSLFQSLSLAATRRYTAGEAGLLEKVSAETRSQEMANLLAQGREELENARYQLSLLTGIEAGDLLASQPLQKNSELIALPEPGDTSAYASAPTLTYYQRQAGLGRQLVQLERARLFPGLVLGYQNQGAPDAPWLPRFSVGLTIPLWFPATVSRLRAAGIRAQMANTQYQVAQKEWNSTRGQALTDYRKYAASLRYYETAALAQADTLTRTASRAFAAGEIDYVVYTLSLTQAFDIRQAYFQTLRLYNQSLIQLHYLNGQ